MSQLFCKKEEEYKHNDKKKIIWEKTIYIYIYLGAFNECFISVDQ